jgi:hypothetical protein
LLARISATAIGCALAGCAPMSTTRTPSTDAQEFPMIATDAPITAEDIGHRVLKLIDSLHSAQDIAPERIEKATGIKVEFNDEDRNIYGFGGKLTDQWSYSLVSTPDKLGEKPNSLRFSFDDTTRDHADPAPVCTLKFDDYSQAMTAAGFAISPIHTYPGSDAWYFKRGDIGVMAYTQGKADTQAGPVCLSKLIISAYA